MTDTARIAEKLKQTMSGTSGVWRYHDGWTDQRVADELGVSRHLVNIVRTQHFSRIEPTRPLRVEDAIAHLTRLHDQADATLAAISVQLGELAVRLNEAEERLAAVDSVMTAALESVEEGKGATLEETFVVAHRHPGSAR